MMKRTHKDRLACMTHSILLTVKSLFRLHVIVACVKKMHEIIKRMHICKKNVNKEL